LQNHNISKTHSLNNRQQIILLHPLLYFYHVRSIKWSSMLNFGLFRLLPYSLLYKITIYLANEEMFPKRNQFTLRWWCAFRQILLSWKLHEMSARKSALQNLPANTYPRSNGLLPWSRIAFWNGCLFQLPFRRCPLLPKYKRLSQPTVLYHRATRTNLEAEWYKYFQDAA